MPCSFAVAGFAAIAHFLRYAWRQCCKLGVSDKVLLVNKDGSRTINASLEDEVSFINKQAKCYALRHKVSVPIINQKLIYYLCIINNIIKENVTCSTLPNTFYDISLALGTCDTSCCR